MMGSVEQLDDELLQTLERDFREVAERAGKWLVCEPGCSECCHGPFPVTRLDVERLRRGLAALGEQDPQRAEVIKTRARQAVEQLREGFPGDGASGRLNQDERALDAYIGRHGSLGCPVLDPRTGHCELYDARPVSCRSYGPPLRFDDVDSTPCRLCFRGADRQTVERCRLAPDPRGLEQQILTRMGVAAGEEWETLIAFAVSYL